MKLEILTVFPDFFQVVFAQSILGRAQSGGVLDVVIHDLRSFTTDKHSQVDDYRFGGGAGMLLKPEPFFRALEGIFQNASRRPLVIYPSPQGVLFNQEIADSLAKEQHVVYLCGHYKGIDQRVIERWVDREYSLGDYVLTGGEIAVAAMVDASVRMIPGVLGNLDSAKTDSHRAGMLDCSHYTRPEEYAGMRVPELLLKGHHRNIEIWRRETARLNTQNRRPDLMTLNRKQENGKLERNS